MFIQMLTTEYFLEAFIVIYTNFKFANSRDNSIRSSRSFEEVKDVNFKCISVLSFSCLDCLI